MCYGCELKSTLGTETVPEYLNVRHEYDAANAQIKRLLARMEEFEKTLTDREQRRAWHATRSAIRKGKAQIGVAMNRIRPDIHAAPMLPNGGEAPDEESLTAQPPISAARLIPGRRMPEDGNGDEDASNRGFNECRDLWIESLEPK